MGSIRKIRTRLAAAVELVLRTITSPDAQCGAASAPVEPLELRVMLSGTPAWLAPGSAATWDATAHALTVTGPATIVADPGADEPLVTVSGSGAALTIEPTSDTWVHLGGLTLTNGGRAEVTRPNASSFDETASPVVELGVSGNTSMSPLTIDSGNGSTLGIEDNDLIVRGGTDAVPAYIWNVAVQAGGLPSSLGTLNPADFHQDGLATPDDAAAAQWDVAGRSLTLDPGDVLAKYFPAAEVPAWPTPGEASGGGSTTLATREQIGPRYVASAMLAQPDLASGPLPAYVVSAVVNGDNPGLLGPQRSMVDGVLYTFSEPVRLDPNTAFNIAVQSGQTGTIPTLSLAAVNPDASGAATQWDVTFGGASVIAGSIANGVYVLTLNPAAVTSEANPTLPAQIHNPDIFFRLFGDGDANGVVNDADNTLLAAAMLNNNPAFDYNGDGAVNAGDNLQFKKDMAITFTGTISFSPAALRPTGVSAAVTGPEAVTLSWTGPSDPSVSGYSVQRWAASSGTWTTVATGLPADSTSYTDPAAPAGDTCEYRVAAEASGLISDWSLPSNDVTTPVWVDAGLTATAVSASELDLGWNANAVPTATGIDVQASSDGVSFTTIAPSLDPAATQYPDTNLPENTLRAYQLIYQTPGGNLVAGPVFAYTLPAVDALSAVAASDTEVDLSWACYAPDATGFEIDRSTDGGSTWTPLPPAPAGQLTYNDTGLSPDTDYTYRVAAQRPGGLSQYTGPADAFTLPAAPDDGTWGGSALTATANGTGEIDLSWSAADPNVYGFDLQRSDDGGQTFSTIADLDRDTTSYSDTDVLDGTTYYYQLLASNASGESAPSAVASATTDLAAPSGLVATPLAGQGIQLAWVDNSATSTGFTVGRSDDGTSFTPVTLDADGIDASAVTGRTYYYQVVATNDTTTSKPSDPVQVTDTAADITAVDDTPDSGVIYSVTHGKTLTIDAAGLLANDIDPNTEPTLSVQSFTNPGHGTLTDNHDGTFTYTANASYAGADTFTYTPTDQYNASSNAATVRIAVTDAMPEASSDQIPFEQAHDDQGHWFNYPGQVKGTLAASDPEGDPLTFSAGIVSGEGSFSLDNAATGAYTFTPSQSYTGEVVVEFTASDGILTSNKASEIFAGWQHNNTDPDDAGSGDNDGDEVIAGANLPTAANQHFQVDENGTLTVPARGLLSAAQDTDPASDTDPNSGFPDDLLVNLDLIESPRNGTAAVNADGSFSYTPNTGFTGRDWLTWQVMDGSTLGYYATAFFDVQPVPQAAVTLKVGGATDPAMGVPQDTPFVPVDDGYQSDDQPLADDDPSTVPPVGDPELVPASVSLSVPDGQSATWSLTFGAALRVFMPDPNTGKLNEVKSGDQFTYDLSMPHYDLQVQGIAEGAAVPITAMLVPGGSGQAAQAQVKVDVGPKPLEVEAVNKNVAGSPLNAAQLQAGVYLPISNPGPKNVGGIQYQLPIVIHGLTEAATLRVPKGWVLLDANGNPVQNAGAGLTVQPNANQPDKDYFVEATDNGTNPAITLTPAAHRDQLGVLGNIPITPFVLSYTKGSKTDGVGPVDVPQFGTYEYNVAINGRDSNIPAVKNGHWLSPVGNGKPPQGANTNDMTVTWKAGPDVGDMIYQLNDQFIWQMAVNIYKIEVGPGINWVGGQVTERAQPNRNKVAITSSATVLSAAVTVTGPNGSTGANHITVGFVQNLSVQALTITYQLAGNATLYQASTNKAVVGHPPFWDTSDRTNYVSKLYPASALLRIGGKPYATQFTPTSKPQPQQKTIATYDTPGFWLPKNWTNPATLKGGNITRLAAIDNLTMYVVGTSDESPQAKAVYAGQASTAWSCDESGTFTNNAFTSTGGVSFATPNVWQPATVDSPQPVVSPPRFNDIGLSDYKIAP